MSNFLSIKLLMPILFIGIISIIAFYLTGELSHNATIAFLIVMVVNTIECVVGKLFGVFKPAFGHIRLEGHDHFTLEVRYLHFLAKFSSSGLGTYFLISR